MTSLKLDLTNRVTTDYLRRLTLLRWSKPALSLVFVLVLSAVAASGEGGFGFLRDPRSPGFLLVAGGGAVGALIAYGVGRLAMGGYLAGFELFKDAPVLFTMDEQGLGIPALMTSDPAFWRLVEERRPTLAIPWEDVERVVVHDKTPQGPQLQLYLRGASAAWGRGAGGIAVAGPRFAVRRSFFGSHDAEVVRALRTRLGARLVGSDGAAVP